MEFGFCDLEFTLMRQKVLIIDDSQVIHRVIRARIGNDAFPTDPPIE